MKFIFPTFAVGGRIRDEIMGVKPNGDNDFVTLSPSFSAMREMLVNLGAEIFTENPEFQTVRCRFPGIGAADFTVARRDGISSDGRRPNETSVVSSLTEDLARRDFSIGAIAKNLETGEIIDPFNGRADIAAKCIRCVGNPIDRFKEDKLRIFRALRFAITKGFNIHQDTAHAMHQFSHEDFAGVSTERITTELEKMFAANSMLAARTLFMGYTELGDLVIERGIWLKPTTQLRK